MSHRKPKTETHYEISVWDISEGDLVRKFWNATEDYLADIEEQYRDEPFYSIVIDREWEKNSDD